MAKVRIILDVEVSADELSHKEIGGIANSIRNAVNGIDKDKPEWFTVFCKTAKYEPVGANLWSVERLHEEKASVENVTEEKGSTNE